MASKSKRRGRVFRASCILAALIIAGSSFAWFTSKDEVTNRLTASSDYGVSIVESFTPPKNWLPGQEINKDVYAVNTGNIDAFVKENVQGVLNYTYEDVVVDFDNTSGNKYVELTLDQVKAIEGQTTEDGFKTYEAGGYLAWTNAVNSTTTTTPASYSVGDTAVTLTTGLSVKAYPSDDNTTAPMTFTVSCVDPTDNTKVLYAESDSGTLYTLADGINVPKVYTDSTKTLTKTDATSTTTTTPVESGSVYEGRTQDITKPWTPTETGVYVFRRSINPQNASSQGKDIGNPFTYSGYYFVKGEGNTPDKYYKIVLGSDKYPAAEKTIVYKTDNNGNTTTEVERVDFVYDIFTDSKDIVSDATNNDLIDQETGEIKTDVGYMFVVEKEVTDQDVIFTFEEKTGDHAPRLVAEYTIAYDGDSTYDANAVLARAQVDYQNALGAYDAAKAHYDNAVANHAYGEALAKAEQELYEAKVELEAKYTAVHDTTGNPAGAQKQWEDARDAAYNGAKYTDDGSVTKPTGFTDNGIRERANDSTTTLDDLNDGINKLKSVSDANDPAGIMPDEVMQAIGDPNADPASNPYVAALHDENSDFYKAFKNYKNLYEEIYDTDGLYDEVKTALSSVISNSDSATVTDTGSAADAKKASSTLKTKAAKLYEKMQALKKAYTDFINAKDLVTGLNTTSPSTTPAATALTTMEQVAKDFSDNATKVDELVDTYVQEEKEYNEAKEALDKATEDWKKAVLKYNADVLAAQKAYNSEDANDTVTSAKEANTAAGAWDSNNQPHQFEDKSGPIVVGYSAISRKTSDTSNPTDPDIKGDKDDNTTDLGKVYAYTGDKSTMPDGISIRNQKDASGNLQNLTDDTAAFGVVDHIGDETHVNTTSKTEKTWKNAIEEETNGYKDKLAKAKHAYDVAKKQNESGSTLKFYVNLVDDYDTYWTMDPDTDKTKDVDFYLNKVLEAGETSHKLIDSVEFDKDVSAGSYKDLTFDLNVGLDSIQVTYDENQRGYTTDAVKADPNFAGMSAAVTAADANGNNVTWTDNAGVPAPTAP